MTLLLESMLLVLVYLSIAVLADDMHLLKVNTIDKDDCKSPENAEYSDDMTLSAVRASASEGSPIKWSAFCKSRTFKFNPPFYSFDYEANDLNRVTKYYSPSEEIEASFIFIGQEGKPPFAMPICPFSTFAQLRDRIGNRLDNRDFSFVVANLDEEHTRVSSKVRISPLKGVTPGAKLLSLFRTRDEVQARTIYISIGGKPILLAKEKDTWLSKIKNKIWPKSEKVQEAPKFITVELTLHDESLAAIPNVDVDNTTVGQLRDLLKNHLDEKQKESKFNETLAICSPFTGAELSDKDLLSNNVLVSKGDVVSFSVMFMSLVDWPNGNDQPVIATVCPRSTFTQLISRAAPSFSKVRSIYQYAVPHNIMLTATIPPEFVKGYRSEAEENPLHLRYSDSIFVKIQDGDGHRMVMVQDKGHRYSVGLMYERFEELLGKERGRSLAICAPADYAHGAIEFPETTSLKDQGLAYDGVQLDAMVIRVKATIENARETKELMMNVCAKTTIAVLETRIKLALNASDDDQVFFLSERMGALFSKLDIDLRMFRSRPPVHPSRTLYVWIGKEPFFVNRSGKYQDGFINHLNVIYTLPDETVQCFNNVDEDMPVHGLKEEIRKRLMGDMKTMQVHNTMAICTPLNEPLTDNMLLGSHLSRGDNKLGIFWVTLKDWTWSDEPVVVTACAGETYRQLIARCAPSFKDVRDAGRYQIMDGSFLDSLISREYLADESGLHAAATLEIRTRDERIVQVQGPDDKMISVSVPISAKVSDLRGALGKKLGPAVAWGIGLCRSPGISRLWEGIGELPEDSKLFSSKSPSDRKTLKSHHSLIVLLRFQGRVTRIPCTVCSTDLDELKERMRRAVGAASDAMIMVQDDERSPLIRYLPQFRQHSPLILHMEIIIKRGGAKADKDDKKGAQEPRRGDDVQAPLAAPEPGFKQKNAVKNGLIVAGLLIVLSLMAYIIVSPSPEVKIEVISPSDQGWPAEMKNRDASNVQ